MTTQFELAIISDKKKNLPLAENRKDKKKMRTLLTKVIEEAKTLPEEQLKEVSKFIKSLKNQKGYKSLSQFSSSIDLLKIMLNEGLIEELPDFDAEDEPELGPISYTGKPFSETIIEDRGPK